MFKKDKQIVVCLAIAAIVGVIYLINLFIPGSKTSQITFKDGSVVSVKLKNTNKFTMSIDDGKIILSQPELSIPIVTGSFYEKEDYDAILQQHLDVREVSGKAKELLGYSVGGITDEVDMGEYTYREFWGPSGTGRGYLVWVKDANKGIKLDQNGMWDSKGLKWITVFDFKSE
ncbi:MAG: hypothetical protein PHC41_11940 [Lachnospiraceae bacterium]|nr:hypothetical protein [Lachnospiraceae bacterium]MDD3616920.1 hypothetical protein [Lachnospiraceae bacterium]